MIDPDIIHKINHSPKIAIVGNGGNLAIAQHAASDMTRHLDKFCFAPDAIHTTALGGDGNWQRKWISEYAIYADCIIAITTRNDSPIIRGLCDVGGKLPHKVVICPVKVPVFDTIVVEKDTYHEFECAALHTLYMIMEQCGAVLPRIAP